MERLKISEKLVVCGEIEFFVVDKQIISRRVYGADLDKNQKTIFRLAVGAILYGAFIAQKRFAP